MATGAKSTFIRFSNRKLVHSYRWHKYTTLVTTVLLPPGFVIPKNDLARICPWKKNNKQWNDGANWIIVISAEFTTGQTFKFSKFEKFTTWTFKSRKLSSTWSENENKWFVLASFLNTEVGLHVVIFPIRYYWVGILHTIRQWRSSTDNSNHCKMTHWVSAVTFF